MKVCLTSVKIQAAKRLLL